MSPGATSDDTGPAGDRATRVPDARRKVDGRRSRELLGGVVFLPRVGIGAAVR